MPTAPLIPSPVTRGIGEGQAFGTFGELLQGVLLEGERVRHFLVTLPISEGSTARFASELALSDVHVWPLHKVKSQQLARDLLKYWDLPPGGQLELRSQLPEGKGLASSSADLVATARAIATHFSLALSTPLLQSLMRRIEPSDGVMYDEITAFYHRDVELLGRLGAVPALTIVAVDEGGQVDTLSFNTQPLHVTHSDTETYARLLADVRTAVADGNLSELGRIATRSAMMNQSRLAKRWLEEVVDICERAGALGVVAAHSGTYLGILLATDSADFPEKHASAKAQLLALTGRVMTYRTRCARSRHG